MEKVRPVVARNARELTKVLGLAPADGMKIDFRSDLNDKIIEVVAKKGLTLADVARLAPTSLTRVTAILTRNTHDISTDLMLRVLASLGLHAKLQFKSAALEFARACLCRPYLQNVSRLFDIIRDSPSAQLYAALQVLHFVPALRVCGRAPSRSERH